MSRERMVLIGLAVLTIGALLFAGAAAGRRSAWMEGYMMGRLSAVSPGTEAGVGEAGAGAAAAMLPYAPYGVGFAHRGPGFGGVLLLMLGVGAVVFFAGRFAHRARRHAWMAMQAAQESGAQGGPQGDWHHGPPPPWMHGPWGHGGWGREPWPAQPTASTGQGQPPAQPTPPSQPAAGQPDAER